ncbi:MAG: nucleotidyltransferase domain-containing protein [archaeon]
MFFKKKISEPVKIILRNPGINVNDLKKQTTSLSNIAETVNELEKKQLIITSYEKNERKLYPNPANNKTLKEYEAIEIEELLKLEEKYPFIKKVERTSESIAGKLKDNLISILLFGSITTFKLAKKSDIDVIIITSKELTEKEQSMITKEFMDLNIEFKADKIAHEVNVVWTTKKDYLSQLHNKTSFSQNLQKNHVLIKGVKEFIKITGVPLTSP